MVARAGLFVPVQFNKAADDTNYVGLRRRSRRRRFLVPPISFEATSGKLNTQRH